MMYTELRQVLMNSLKRTGVGCLYKDAHLLVAENPLADPSRTRGCTAFAGA